MKTGTRISLIAILVSLVLFVAFVAHGRQDKETSEARKSAAETQWEYLVVSGGNVNLSSMSGDQFSGMRKQPDGSFGREAFVLERNLDKLGAKGWQLVSVHGVPNDPIYYLKRPKPAR